MGPIKKASRETSTSARKGGSTTLPYGAGGDAAGKFMAAQREALGMELADQSPDRVLVGHEAFIDLDHDRCGFRIRNDDALSARSVSVPVAGGTPFRAGESHRRLPADVRSLLLRIILCRADRFQFQRIEGTGCGLHPSRGFRCRLTPSANAHRLAYRSGRLLCSRD